MDLVIYILTVILQGQEEPNDMCEANESISDSSTPSANEVIFATVNRLPQVSKESVLGF